MISVRVVRRCGCKQTFTMVGGDVREEIRPCEAHKEDPDVLSPSPPISLSYHEEGSGN